MNLGDGIRVFHDRLNNPVVIGIGRIVRADLPKSVVQGIINSRTPETVLVCEPNAKIIPEEIRAVVELLSLIDAENEETIRRMFRSIVPPGHMTDMNLSRMQIRVVLRTMVED